MTVLSGQKDLLEKVPNAVFTDFVRANTPALMRKAYRLTGSALAAEELVQDTGKLRHDRAISCYLRCALPHDWSAVAHSNPQLAELEK